MRYLLNFTLIFLLILASSGCVKSNKEGPQEFDSRASQNNEEQEISPQMSKAMDWEIRPILEKTVGKVKLVHFGKSPMGGWMLIYRSERELKSEEAIDRLSEILKEKGYRMCRPFEVDIVWLEGNPGNRKFIRVAIPSLYEITVEYVNENEDPSGFKNAVNNLKQISEKCAKIL